MQLFWYGTEIYAIRWLLVLCKGLGLYNSILINFVKWRYRVYVNVWVLYSNSVFKCVGLSWIHRQSAKLDCANPNQSVFVCVCVCNWHECNQQREWTSLCL